MTVSGLCSVRSVEVTQLGDVLVGAVPVNLDHCQLSFDQPVGLAAASALQPDGRKPDLDAREDE